MSILHQAHLAESEKRGRWVYYRLPDRRAFPAAARALHWVRASLAADAQVAEDLRRLRALRKADLRKLCKCYRS